MHNEAFYATTAQVLPALLIAFTVEIGLYAIATLTQQEVVDQWRQTLRDDRPTAYFFGYFLGSVATWVGFGFFFAAPAFMVLIFLGEAAAVLVLFSGTGGAWTPVAGWICLVAMIGGTALVLWMPMYRLVKQIGSRLRQDG